MLRIQRAYLMGSLFQDTLTRISSDVLLCGCICCVTLGLFPFLTYTPWRGEKHTFPTSSYRCLLLQITADVGLGAMPFQKEAVISKQFVKQYVTSWM